VTSKLVAIANELNNEKKLKSEIQRIAALNNEALNNNEKIKTEFRKSVPTNSVKNVLPTIRFSVNVMLKSKVNVTG
jgi:hypothetical protein